MVEVAFPCCAFDVMGALIVFFEGGGVQVAPILLRGLSDLVASRDFFLVLRWTCRVDMVGPR